MEIKERLTAYKIWISDLLVGSYVEQQGEPDYVDAIGRKVSRINLIASVVDTFTRDGYATLTLDDGSSQIRLKTFKDDTKLLQDISMGNIILVVARVRSFNNELYLVPEILRKVDNKRALLRRLELINEYGERKSAPRTVKQSTLAQVENEEETSSEKYKIVKLLERLDEGEGVEINLLLKEFQDREKARDAIEKLLKEGDAYEPRPGKIKLII
ncbi:MAG: hypothetical protein AABX59_03570 [Nanoarchaeota archaeon]